MLPTGPVPACLHLLDLSHLLSSSCVLRAVKLNITVLTFRDFSHASSALQQYRWYTDFKKHQDERHILGPTSIIVDKYMCAGSMVFWGSQMSSFSLDIDMIRAEGHTASQYDGVIELPK